MGLFVVFYYLCPTLLRPGDSDLKAGKNLFRWPLNLEAEAHLLLVIISASKSLLQDLHILMHTEVSVCVCMFYHEVKCISYCELQESLKFKST